MNTISKYVSESVLIIRSDSQTWTSPYWCITLVWFQGNKFTIRSKWDKIHQLASSFISFMALLTWPGIISCLVAFVKKNIKVGDTFV